MSRRSEIAATAVLIAAVLGAVVYLTHGSKQESLPDQRFIAITDQNPTLAAMPLLSRVALGHEYCTDPARASNDVRLDAAALHTLRIAATTAYCPR